MTIEREQVHLAALRLLEMADRVLGEGAPKSMKVRYVNELLSRLGAALDPQVAVKLRVAAYEQLFADAASRPCAGTVRA